MQLSSCIFYIVYLKNRARNNIHGVITMESKINSNIILIGATNRIDQIDKAIISRFSYIHKVIALNKSEREQYVKKYLSDIHLNELTDSIDISDDNISQRKLEKNIIDSVARYLYKTNKV